MPVDAEAAAVLVYIASLANRGRAGDADAGRAASFNDAFATAGEAALANPAGNRGCAAGSAGRAMEVASGDTVTDEDDDDDDGDLAGEAATGVRARSYRLGSS